VDKIAPEIYSLNVFLKLTWYSLCLNATMQKLFSLPNHV